MYEITTQEQWQYFRDSSTTLVQHKIPQSVPSLSYMRFHSKTYKTKELKHNNNHTSCAWNVEFRSLGLFDDYSCFEPQWFTIIFVLRISCRLLQTKMFLNHREYSLNYVATEKYNKFECFNIYLSLIVIFWFALNNFASVSLGTRKKVWTKQDVSWSAAQR